jgi:hypothetical protein
VKMPPGAMRATRHVFAKQEHPKAKCPAGSYRYQSSGGMRTARAAPARRRAFQQRQLLAAGDGGRQNVLNDALFLPFPETGRGESVCVRRPRAASWPNAKKSARASGARG